MKKEKRIKRKNDELISISNLNIKERREELEMSQTELDELTGLRTCKYESGKQEII